VTRSTHCVVHVLGIYFGVVMLMCALSMIMTIVVLNLHHRSPEMYEMPDWVRAVRSSSVRLVLIMSAPPSIVSSELMPVKTMIDAGAKAVTKLYLYNHIRTPVRIALLCAALR